jgi:hypothetical protein
LSLFQWIGSSNADLGNGGNWVDTTEPGMGQPPGVNDVAIIQVGQGLYGTLNVAGLDIVQASGAPTISITGSSTQITAASVGIGLGFTLDTGAYLQAGTLGIDGDGTAVTVQNNALLYDYAGENDVLSIGASTGRASVLLTRGGSMYYASQDASGTLNLGGVSNSTATMTVSAGGYFAATLSGVNIGAAASGATGVLNVTGAGSQFLVDNYGYTTIGDFGELGGSAQGTVNVTAGGYVSLSSDGEVLIGTSAGMAKILVSGANSAVEAGPYVQVGIEGSNVEGEILVSSGGEFDTATDMYLNNGTISVSGANSLFTGRFLVTDGGTTVQVSTGGSIHVADVELGGIMRLTSGMVNTRAAFTMYGGSEVLGTGTLAATTIANAGQIIAGSGGTLAVAGSITGTGTMGIQSGATLDVSGSVAASQTTVFDSGSNTLALGDAAQFVGRILDFATGDAIDLLGKAATKLAYTTGLLTVSNGSTLVAKLGVKGSYTTASFKLISDNHGGSLISYVPPNAIEPRPIGAMFPHPTF